MSDVVGATATSERNDGLLAERIDAKVHQPSAPTSGSLRIYARRGDAEIKIIADATPVPGADRLVDISFFPDIAVAQAVATYCAELLGKSGMEADPEGWHPLPAQHVKTLLANAKTHLNVTFVPEAVDRGRRPWTSLRIARLAFLAGQGWTAKAIADDPLILSTPGNVQRQAGKLGIALSEVPQGQIHLRLPHSTTAALDRMAASANMTRNAYLRRHIIRSVAEPEIFRMLDPT